MLSLVTGIIKEFAMDSITQKAKFRLSAIKFAKSQGVTKVARELKALTLRTAKAGGILASTTVAP